MYPLVPTQLHELQMATAQRRSIDSPRAAAKVGACNACSRVDGEQEARVVGEAFLMCGQWRCSRGLAASTRLWSVWPSYQRASRRGHACGGERRRCVHAAHARAGATAIKQGLPRMHPHAADVICALTDRYMHPTMNACLLRHRMRVYMLARSCCVHPGEALQQPPTCKASFWTAV